MKKVRPLGVRDGRRHNKLNISSLSSQPSPSSSLEEAVEASAQCLEVWCQQSLVSKESDGVMRESWRVRMCQGCAEMCHKVYQVDSRLINSRQVGFRMC